ncbi:serine hydrolase [Luteimonas aestuarii]|uniref:Serine hydrolase n=2 Tax=Luteimonas aestuarii TaxID=453837 RepID=A0A4R5U579_9GAMM|nr:serine hydrolase [Luteimonas aestuarii]
MSSPGAAHCLGRNGGGLRAGRLLRLALMLFMALPVAAVASGAVASGRMRSINIEAIDALVADASNRYALPGLAIGIVVDGQVAYTLAQGVLSTDGRDPVDRATVFKIASNSKPMTTALLARLVEQGKLAWNDPVRKYLPDFRMPDDWVTRELQVRDLLVHHAGFGPGAGDLMFWPEPNRFNRQDVLHGLRHLRPGYSFRSRYVYNNALYVVAGEVAAAAGGAPYDVLVRREVFAPLGMARCQAGAWQRDAVGNVAQPHIHREGRNLPIRPDPGTIPDAPMMAAGGLRCSLDDMLAWMQAWLQPEGDVVGIDGHPWLSQAQRGELWKAHVAMPLTQRMREWDRSHFSAYGYGWRLTDVDGTAQVSHTGTLAGMYSSVVLLPELRVGIVFMANGDAGEARTVLMQALAKQFTSGDPARHTVDHYASLLVASREATTESMDAGGDARMAATAAELGDRLGRYRDPWFGEALVCPKGDGVQFQSLKSPKLSGDVMHVDGRWLVDWRDVDVDAEAWLEFQATESGHMLRMKRTNPAINSSYGFQDLAFQQVGGCATE